MSLYDKVQIAREFFNEDEYEKAYSIFDELATKHNDKEALYFLGLFYENGYAVKKDEDKALKYYKKAAKYGSVDAAYALQSRGMTTICRM